MEASRVIDGEPRIHRLFDEMLAAGASDLHLASSRPPMVRVRGELTPLGHHSDLSAENLAEMLEELNDPVQAAIFRKENDLDFAYAFGDKARFRGNYLRTLRGVGAVFRVIPSRVLSLASLNLPPAIESLTRVKGGLVLVTGPTGSGKSTTLAAMLDAINETRSGHILTIEDPVEFVHQPKRCQITHREVGRDVVSFQEAVRSAGREDADVILVGELRGSETMRLALQASSSGALVFATVHTNSATSTIDRFINAFSAEQQPAIRGMLAESLTGVVAQQLIKRSDQKGRIAVQEILLGNRAVSASIREGRTMMLPSIMQSCRAEGMQGLDDTLLTLVKTGIISAHDAWAKASDKEQFQKNSIIEPLLAQDPGHG